MGLRTALIREQGASVAFSNDATCTRNSAALLEIARRHADPNRAKDSPRAADEPNASATRIVGCSTDSPMRTAGRASA
jgi:hypothetical protein